MAVDENEGSKIEPRIQGMVDIFDKPVIKRTAVARGTIYLNSESIYHIRNNSKMMK